MFPDKARSLASAFNHHFSRSIHLSCLLLFHFKGRIKLWAVRGAPVLLFVSAKVATGKSNMFGAKKDIRELEMEGGNEKELIGNVLVVR